MNNRDIRNIIAINNFNLPAPAINFILQSTFLKKEKQNKIENKCSFVKRYLDTGYWGERELFDPIKQNYSKTFIIDSFEYEYTLK